MTHELQKVETIHLPLETESSLFAMIVVRFGILFSNLPLLAQPPVTRRG